MLLPNLFGQSSTTSVASSTSVVGSDASTATSFADAQHKCDTGMVWSQYVNKCIAQDSGANPADNMDKYILKTTIVPPVCPVCAQAQAQAQATAPVASTDSCQPCPACARCPEPAFSCKKVPNYNRMATSNADNGLLDTNSFSNSELLINDNKIVPRPLLTDFSAFDK